MASQERARWAGLARPRLLTLAGVAAAGLAACGPAQPAPERPAPEKPAPAAPEAAPAAEPAAGPAAPDAAPASAEAAPELAPKPAPAAEPEPAAADPVEPAASPPAIAPADAAPQKDAALTNPEEGTQVRLALGGALTLRLTEPGGTGYIWRLADPVTPDDALGPPLEREEPGSGADGAPGARVFMFTALRTGEMTLELHLGRPFGDGEPVQVARILVEVVEG